METFTVEQERQIERLKSLQAKRYQGKDYVGFCCECDAPIRNDERYGTLINVNYYGDVTSVRYTHLWH